MATRSEMIERWLQYCATKTDRHDIFLAGIGLLNDGDNAQYYATVGPDVPACYDCHSNNGESYRKLLDIAKTNYWRAQA